MQILTEALKLSGTCGFCVFPVKAGGKTPLIKKWPEKATTDEATIREWWTAWPNANIGIATGAKSGVFVLDVDPKDNGLHSLEQLQEEVGGPFKTLTAKTGSGGFHFYFRYDPGRPISNSASELGPGLDIRGDGGYVVAPPSLHVSGNRYEWVQ